MCRRMVVVLVSTACLISTASADLVGRWTFDDGAGATARDSSGQGNDGTLIGGPTWATEEGHAGVLMLDGVDDHMVVEGAYTLPLYSVALWFRIDGGTGPRNIFGAYGAAGELYGASLQLEADGSLRYVHRFPFGSSGGTNIYTDTIYDEGVWYHGTIVKSPDTMTLYINGEEAGTAADSTQFDQTALTVALSVLRHDNLQRFVTGAVDDLQLYNHPLTVAEVQEAMMGIERGLASRPNPADAALDVPRDVVLKWTPGAYAQTHDVYLGTVYDDVNDATTTDLVYQGRQDQISFAPGSLTLEETYYWRIDEVNSPPDSTVYKGQTWSFEVEPVSIAIPIGLVTATASSTVAPQDPNNTVNGSGLDESAAHSNLIQDMWISDMSDSEPWIQFAFEKTQKLDRVHVWNHNSQSEGILGFGTQEALIEYSVDGENWSELGTVTIAQASGTSGYAGVEVPLSGIVAQYVRINCLSNWSILPAVTQKGLSEVRFFAVPVYAREPQPADGVITDGTDITLQWRAGREAISHKVLLSSDPDAVEDGSAVVGTTEDSQFQTGPLSYDTLYFWQIIEVNETATPTAYVGDLWQFTTPANGVIDDMEMYKATEGLRLWEHWIDGFDNPGENGAVVGNGDDAEKSIVHSGSQSLPMAYNNSAAPISEATRTFDAPLDLTASEVQGLVLYFHGSASNTGGSLYVKINDARVPYDSDAGNLRRPGWSKWFIPLAEVTGTDLTQVTALTIGVDNGGQGVVYVDDIIVTPAARELITPVDPGADGLVSHYAFEGNAADSTGQHPGTIMGFALFEPGAVGQAISLGGLVDNYVEITGYKGIVADTDGVQHAFSVACWFKTSENGDMVTWGSADGAPDGGQYMTFRVEGGNLRTEHGDGNLRGNTICNDGEWHHGAVTVAEGATLRVPQTMLYIDGQADGVNSGSDNVYNVTADADVNIGQRSSHADRWFPGALDEVMIYDRVLSAGEVAALAGRTQPFDKP